jgi:kynurenine formamidase
LGVVEAEHIRAWERVNGEIDAGDIVLINLGWAK